MRRAKELHHIRAAIRGNPVAFGVLYTANHERVFRYILRRVGDEMLAEDLTSDVFVHALAGMRRYQDRGKPFVAWLYRIARSRVADYYRQLTRDPGIIHLDDVYVAALPNLDTRLMQQELAAYVYKIIIALTEDQQQVVILRFVEDRPVKEVARLMGKDANAVKQLQHRALRAIAGRMERAGVTPAALLAGLD